MDILFEGTPDETQTFRFENMPDVPWQLHPRDHGRVEEGDIAWVEIQSEFFGRPDVQPDDIPNREYVHPRLIRVSKGGDPAFQG